MTVTFRENHDSILATLAAGETFWPSEPRTLEETGLTMPFVEALLCKTLLVAGNSTGRKLAQSVGLPFGIVDGVLSRLRNRQWVVHVNSSAFNDYVYSLTDSGRSQAEGFRAANSYVGPAPVPLMDYVISVEAQAIGGEAIRRAELEDAFHDISVDPGLFETLGPAVNSGSGLFLFGSPGNGKSTLAKRITSCFGQEVWIPNAVLDDDDLVKVFDPAYHHDVHAILGDRAESMGHDQRWRRITRPTVVVGGELTMDNLEIRSDPKSGICEAPLQMKSNCGCLLIDDFGRQRISPEELLNRWIVPLENKHDFLTLPNGKKIQVPFEQLIIFSTNLDPDQLVDEAFLRRIPYKIEVNDPSEEEFQQLFQLAADAIDCPFDPDAVEYLLETYYRCRNRPLRRCHPRDLLKQVRDLCTYDELHLEMKKEYFDHVARGFFTTVLANSEG